MHINQRLSARKKVSKPVEISSPVPYKATLAWMADDLVIPFVFECALDGMGLSVRAHIRAPCRGDFSVH